MSSKTSWDCSSPLRKLLGLRCPVALPSKCFQFFPAISSLDGRHFAYSKPWKPFPRHTSLIIERFIECLSVPCCLNGMFASPVASLILENRDGVLADASEPETTKFCNACTYNACDCEIRCSLSMWFPVALFHILTILGRSKSICKGKWSASVLLELKQNERILQ